MIEAFQQHTPQEVDQLLSACRRVHFIGIGGSGMYPLVQILHAKGYQISGSDCNDGDIIGYERALGIPVELIQRPENLTGAELVVYTAAILPDNPELCAARDQGLPCLERSLLLGWVTRQFARTVGVCGTHGKTTTTAMLTQLLLEGGLDPSAVVGGKLPAIHGYGRLGNSDLCVVESCEFVDTFLKLSPAYGILLNIDNDHLDYFKTMENLTASFRKFVTMAHLGVFVNGDDGRSMEAVSGLTQPVYTFGLGEQNRFTAVDLEPGQRSGWSFTLRDNGKPLGRVRLKIPGRHNVYNALAAGAAALILGMEPEAVCRVLGEFGGAGRRFEILGHTAGGATVADDYAHHPTELSATLEAALEMGYDRVWAVFQPFTYSRTQRLMEEFAAALRKADHVVLTEIMGSREVNTFGVSSEQLAQRVPGAVVLPSFEAVEEYVTQRAKPGDLVLTLGCGDIYKAAKGMLNR